MSTHDDDPRREAPYFEQALTDAMHSVTRELGPAALDIARAQRRARTWRAGSAAAFATGGAFLLAATAVALVGGDSSLWADPAAGPVTVTVTSTSGEVVQPSPSPATATALAASAAPTTEASDDAEAAAPPASSPAASSQPEGGTQEGGEDEPPPAEAPQPPSCVDVPDGSGSVRALVLDTARSQLDAWLDDRDDAPTWLSDPSDQDLLQRLDMADAVDAVERDDIIECADGLGYASASAGDLDAVVDRRVADRLRDTLPGQSGDDDDDDD